MAAIERMIRWIETLALTIAATCAVVIAIVMAAQVFWRYGLGAPLLWSEPISVYALVWLVFLGAAVITARWEHVAITSFVDVFPAPIRALARIFGKLAMVVFAVALVIVSFDNLLTGAHVRAPVLGISTLWVKAIIAVSASAMALFSLALAIRDIAHFLARDWDQFSKTGVAQTDPNDYLPDKTSHDARP